ncbi:MAG: DNA repair protein [Anaeroplasmataceae bacterium]
MDNRVYFVIDMKSFFASVECALRGLDAMTTDLVVADNERTDKTICLAVSPSLKAKGVKNRCRLFEIPKNLQYIIAKPRMKKYIEYAANIYSIYLKYIDKNDIFVYSIDECILDVTDYLKLYNIRALDFALKLMNEIYDTYKIPSQTGIGSNMYLAKIALGITAKNSKNRVGWLNEEKFIKTLWNHQPLSDFWQISSGTMNHLARLGIYDMEGIAKASPELLYKEFGVNAELLIDHAYGIEPCTIEDIKNYSSKSKSISNSQILPCGYSFDAARIVVKEMVQSSSYTLALKHYVTDSISIFIGYTNKTIAATSVKLSVRTNLYSFMVDDIVSKFDTIVDHNLEIRKISISFNNLLNDKYEQYDLFSDIKKIEKEKKLRESVLKMHHKYGKNSVLKALDLEDKATQRDRNKLIGGHNSE